MKNNWLSLILGLFLIIFAFLGLPSSVKNKMLIGVGTVVAILSFREIAGKKVAINMPESNTDGAN
ncbi:TPA: hypothetical protein DEW47_02295 [Patescibacteria group bacterium]|nr:hypothetical protein [Patescibacteria group bacterium]HCI04791.1 hypothetical protein [Patescibacteria group bacterium]